MNLMSIVQLDHPHQTFLPVNYTSLIRITVLAIAEQFCGHINVINFGELTTSTHECMKI